MEMKVCLVAAGFFLLLGHVTAQNKGQITGEPANGKVISGSQFKLTCKLDNGNAVPTSGNVLWKKGSATVTAVAGLTLTDPKESVLTVAAAASANSGDYTCTPHVKNPSSGFVVLVEDGLAPTLACTPAPTKLGVETTCTCTKATLQLATPTGNCKLFIGATEKALACNALKYTPVAADKDKQITCKVIFEGPVPADSPVSTTNVVTITYTKQAKPTITGTSVTATADLTIKCAEADTAEKGLEYKLYDETSGTSKEVTLPDKKKGEYTVKICDAEKDKEYKFTCAVVNGAGESPKSDVATVKFTAAGPNCPTTTAAPTTAQPDSAAAGIRPSLMILGFILLLTTILLMQ